MDYISLIIAIGTCLSAIAAMCALYNSIKVQKRTAVEKKQQITIDAFNRMQEQVFDKLVSCSKTQIMYLIDDMDYEPDVREACDATRALIARCEHFAVGVNNDVYDLYLVHKLGGNHIIYVYDKVLPVIDYARSKDPNSYVEFEKMVNSLLDLNKQKA